MLFRSYRAYCSEKKEALFRDSVLSRQLPATGLIEGYGREKVENAALPTLGTDNDNLTLSAFKKTQNREHVLIRFFNPTATEQTGNVQVDGVEKLIPCGLNEQIEDEAAICKTENGFKITVPPYGLKSYLISEA